MADDMMRSAPAPFLMKTYELVDDGGTDDMISWNETGTTFVVWKSAEFARDLLPTYFKHNNFSSFVRQLNTYLQGFRKIVPERWEFENEFFKRGEKELLSEIHRRKRQSVNPPCRTTALIDLKSEGGCNNNIVNNPSESNHSGGEDLMASTSSTSTTSMTDLSDLTGENERLRKDNQSLSLELARIKKQCEHLMSTFLSVSNYDDKDVKVMNYQLQLVDMIQGVGVIGGGGCGPRHDQTSAVVEICYSSTTNNDNIHDQQDNIEDDDELKEECFKLFGVWLKGKNKKRERSIVEMR